MSATPLSSFSWLEFLKTTVIGIKITGGAIVEVGKKDGVAKLLAQIEMPIEPTELQNLAKLALNDMQPDRTFSACGETWIVTTVLEGVYCARGVHTSKQRGLIVVRCAKDRLLLGSYSLPFRLPEVLHPLQRAAAALERLSAK